MKTKHMKKRVSYFKALRGLPKNELKKYISTCEDELIHVICEACFKLCHHHALKDDTERDPLNVYLKKLANKKVPVEYKKGNITKNSVQSV